MWKETVIKPSSSGFGEYEAGEYNGAEWDHESDLIDAMHNGGYDLYELNDTDLPEGIEDIRGRIHNPPDRIFAAIEGAHVFYFGIKEF